MLVKSRLKLHTIVGVALLVMAAGTPAAWPQPVPWPGDVVIQPDLKAEMERLKDGEFVRIIIRLEDQFPPSERRTLLAGQRKEGEGRKILTRALRAFAERSQRPVLELLRDLEKDHLVREIKPLWITNVITAEARIEAIDTIAGMRGIAYLKQDILRPALQQTPAWSVALIDADTVWADTGLSGQGVVVAVIDTGIDLTHPDLVNHIWVNTAEDLDNDGQFSAADENNVDDDGNGRVDDVIGWDFGNGDNDPDDWHGHGTHVSGTIAGDGAGGTATGVAPGVEIMVLSYSASLGSGEAEAWLAMEYALNNGADIVSFSSAWRDGWNPDYQTWRDTSDVLVDAGVLFVVAAGNDSPHDPTPGDVFTPARAPRVFSLGATTSIDTIWGDSGNGPVSWEGVGGYDDYIHPPGLLKPDVSAPGELVNSTVVGGGYGTMNGTSMATPHASGLAALLLEEDPTLLPHELAFIIRENAVDLGAAGADNVYGYGRIDAHAAVDYTYQHTPVYDLSVTGTNQVWTTIDIWVDNDDDGTPDTPVANNDNHLYARVRNIGGQAVGNAEVKFYYADVGTIGISGFDPNGDGDPADGNFTYIDSYFVPVIGPAGSSQDTALAVVDWNVPVPVTDHWCVGIGVVAPDPPNTPEVNTTNNLAFRNFFDIVVTYSQTATLSFFVYPDPMRPEDIFDLEIIRRGLPKEFNVEFAVDRRIAREWFRGLDGLEPVHREDRKNPPEVLAKMIERGERIDAFAALPGERGYFRKAKAPRGEPVLVHLMIRAPDRRTAERMKWPQGEMMLLVNAKNKREPFGGLAVNVHFDEGGHGGADDRRKLFAIRIEDGDEAGLIRQQIGIEAERIVAGRFLYYGEEAVNKRLREYGYQPEEADPGEIFGRLVLVEGKVDSRMLAKEGVKLMLREGRQSVIYATPAQLERLQRSGVTVSDRIPKEPRPRQVRVYLSKREDLRGVAPYLTDYFTINPDRESGDFIALGAAWDGEIDALREQGYTVDVVPEGGH